MVYSLAIMKQGEIFCQGTIPRLKQKYGKGFTVLLKLKSSNESIDEVDGSAQPLLPQHSGDSSEPKTSQPCSKQVEDVKRSVTNMYSKNKITLKDQHLVSYDLKKIPYLIISLIRVYFTTI